MADSDTEYDQEMLIKLMRKQEIQAVKIQTAISNGKKKNTDKRSLGFYEFKIAELSKLWDSFDTGDMKVQELLTELQVTHTYITKDVFSTIQAKYEDYMTELWEGVRQTTPAAPAPINVENRQEMDQRETQALIQQTPLPRISLPTFNGEYEQWRSFHDLFVSVVHANRSLQPVQKLHYLKGCLKGEAERFLSHIAITNEDYEPAWEKLKQRFENKRLLVNLQLKRLVNPIDNHNESTKGLRMLHDTTEECLQQLKALGVSVQNWDTLLIHILMQGLSITTIKLWEEELRDSNELPNLKTFTEFLQTRARVLESVANTIKDKGPSPKSTKDRTRVVNQQVSRTYHVTKRGQSIENCPACNQTHYVPLCKTFINMEPTKRIDCIFKSGRCFNCLSKNHSSQSCTNTHRCKKCGKKHHTMLHRPERDIEDTAVSNIKNNEDNKVATNEIVATHSFFNAKEKDAMLATVLVKTKNRFGKTITIRCLLDPGSQASFITHEVYKKIGLKGIPVAVDINGLNQTETACSNRQVTIPITSCHDNTKSLEVDLLVIKKITDALPFNTFQPSKNWTHLQGLELADPTYWRSGPIDMLIGVDIFAEMLLNELIKGPKDAPIALKTLFGWTILGKSPIQQKIESFLNTTAMRELNQSLVRFWETEETPQIKPQKLEDKMCERHFEETHTRLENGQYQVRLPFIKEPTLGSSKDLAIKRFQHLQKKLSQNEKLEVDYCKCLNEYITLGHMSAIKQSNNTHELNYYIPHHAVFKESSTTKLRVVFDASAKSSNGKSLNEQLITGPTLQPKLFATLLKWRKYKIAMTADIEKMYRMIRIHPEDQKFQRIIWTNTEKNKIEEYELQTVTFGTTSAPYLAMKTLLQLAHDEKEKWPFAAASAKTDFYVDDLLTGADTIQEAKNLQNEHIAMLNSGKFKLRKWASNCKELLADLPLEHVEIRDFLQFDKHESIKTLGIQWVPSFDHFSFNIKEHSTNNILTKRKILSEIASLYDPLGWIAPVVIKAKIIMQNIWISGCSWDARINENIAEEWRKFKENLKFLKEVKIPRWIGFTSTNPDIQIHGFCDASMSAYAAVIYIRVQRNDGTISVNMLTSKTRVAPIKPVTLPRLELCRATLLANLLHTTIENMQFQSIPVTAWTDSTITLHWIKSNPTKWKPYVANRVTEVQEYITPECWRHVPTQDNPADIISRGLNAKDLHNCRLWWNGPDWLAKPENEWPKTKITSKVSELEAKTKVVAMLTTNIDNQLFTRYSSFTKLKRVIARLQRFIYNCKQKNKSNRFSGSLQITEIQTATNTIFQNIQKICFPSEYGRLIQRKIISNHSKLLNLTPFLDKTNIMRVGGRLANADIPYDQKHPIILPPNHEVTTLIIDQIHKETLHGGKRLVLSTSRQRYWIVNAQRLIAKWINKCNICIRHRQKTMSQLMGNLPAVRINISQPFLNVGIDYAGPILLKTSPHRHTRHYKGYFCIFVCMATKAIHLELVTDLTATAFIAALKRFIARRGLCRNIYSDCGTNFKGADVILEKELKQAIKNATDLAAKEMVQQYNITWHFNPPSAPHFGGLWEAGVKSVKFHLKRIIGKAIFTYEEYATLLYQVEACLNSRPLCPLSNSHETIDALTPGHFLIGRPLNAIPEPNMLHEKIPPTKRWKHLQYMTQQFWDRWSKEYLNTLQQKNKWNKTKPNVKIGDIVIIKEDNMSPTVWPLARVMRIFPGKDDVARVVELRTATRVLTRPIVKICPISSNYNH